MSKEQNTNKRLQVLFSDEAWNMIESIVADAKKDFSVGAISYSAVINEMILASKVDLKALQAKHTDVKRSLKHIASQDGVDLDAAIKTLMELKSKMSRKAVRSVSAQEEASNG